jgi:flagellar motor switch protein FliN
MPAGSSSGAPERRLFQEFSAALTSALEAMAGVKPALSWDPLPALPENATSCVRQQFPPFPGAMWLGAAEQDWLTAGRLILRAAGIGGGDANDCKATYLEIIKQAAIAFARTLASATGKPVTAVTGTENDPLPHHVHWAEMQIELTGNSFVIAIGLEVALINTIDAAVAQPAEANTVAVPTGAVAATPPNSSKTFELLLDVELPVSVSFGRAQVPLKDVIKLTTGSIVELNRTIAEPVEIIVNNCVIARGEVVVVEGNFGVRIQEVISRQERLRTLQ